MSLAADGKDGNINLQLGRNVSSALILSLAKIGPDLNSYKTLCLRPNIGSGIL